jgi:hypothetical protein
VSGASLPRDSFDGPLDLLLDEVRRQRIAIEEVALAPLVARYLAYMETAAAQQLPLDIDWILLAATLIQWKSRSLLPATGTSARDPIRDEIVELLLTHRKQAAARSRQAPVGGSRPALPRWRSRVSRGSGVLKRTLIRRSSACGISPNRLAIWLAGRRNKAANGGNGAKAFPPKRRRSPWPK